jgi:predicted dehydrogenase
MGMIGGCDGAFIGNIHRMAASIDGNIELVAGAFSQDAEKSVSFGLSLGLDKERSYCSYETLIKNEKQLAPEKRLDFISIVTPNKSHFEIAHLALQNGFHVFCEKPATLSLKEALELQSLVKETGLVFAVAHTYSAYPMVTEARQRVVQGDIGKIFKVMVDYSQGWLSPKYLPKDQKQASWRLSPELSGISCCMGDIGIHGANLAEFIIDKRISSVLADLSSSDDRLLDDDGVVLLRFNDEIRGVLSASQICVGEENNLSIRIFGDKGSLKWRQQDPDTLLMQQGNQPLQTLRNGAEYLSDATLAISRTPSGHNQGYIEAFANLYLQFYQQVSQPEAISLLPTIEEGIAGMAFIEAVIESNNHHNTWTKLSA